MRKLFSLFFLILLVAGAFAGCVSDVGAPSTEETGESKCVAWLYGYAEALALANERGVPVLVDVYTDWCYYCVRMDDKIYSNATVVERSNEFVCLKIDGDKNRDLVEKYDIAGYPTTLFLDGAGKEIAGTRIAGYPRGGVPEFLNRMADALEERNQK